MADVNLVINNLDIIANAAYQSVHQGPPSSRPTAHRQAFNNLQGTAAQTRDILTQNPNPNRDIRENIGNSFASMQQNVNAYCTKTAGTDDVLRAFNKAQIEWQLLRQELGG